MDKERFALKASPSDLNAFFAKIPQHRVNTPLIDLTDRRGAEAEADEALLLRGPETVLLDIREEANLRLPVGVGDPISNHRAFTCNLADL